MSTCTLNSDALAEKLRRENWEQFIILVRMHLSFVLDLNTDESEALNEKNKLKKWNFIPFHKKNKPNKGIMDGIPLTQEGICQVYQLIEFLKKEPNICAEGLFRRTGSLTRQQELRGLLNQGVTVSLDNNNYSVHDCASVLKGFLAELPEPLLTDAHYPAHCQIAELCGICEKPTQEHRLLHALQLLLLLLPPENRILLRDVLDLLHLTASYESKNKMSAESLATLFTPHLLCPRNLTPEGLHINCQTLSGIVSFMIKRHEELFQLPPKLAVDIKAYYTERERRKMSPKRNCNESISDNFAANTVYSFVDVERTAKENQSNPTETALAQLYAHIQSLPESSKKRKLVKQFNRQNGHGTPIQLLRSNAQKNKSLGSSIKKHIFQKGLAIAGKKNGIAQQRSSSDELLNETMMTPRSRKPVLLVSGTNINALPKLEINDFNMDSVEEEEDNSKDDSNIERGSLKRSKSVSDIQELEETASKKENEDPLTSTFREYLRSRSIITATPTDSSFSSCTDDFCSAELDTSHMSSSMLHCLNGFSPDELNQVETKAESTSTESKIDEKEFVLRPKQFDMDGKPIVYETSF